MKEGRGMVRSGGIAVLLQGLGYVAFSIATVLLVFTQHFTIEDFQDPALLLKLAAASPQTVSLLKVLDSVYLAHAVLSFVVLVALLQHVRRATFSQKLLALGPALVNSTLYLAAAASHLVGVPIYVQLYTQQGEQALTGYRVLFLLTFQAENVAGAAYGVSIMVISWMAWQTRALPRTLCLLGILWGGVALLSWPFFLVAALGSLGIVWCGWLGICLLRTSTTPQGTIPREHLLQVCETNAE